MTPILFGTATVAIDQSALSRLSGTRKYAPQKKNFNRLVQLRDRAISKGTLDALSDKTQIGFYGKKYGSEKIVQFRLYASVSAWDAQLNQSISRTYQKSVLEPVGQFWQRVLRGAKKLDKLQQRAQASGKNGTYTVEEGGK